MTTVVNEQGGYVHKSRYAAYVCSFKYAVRVAARHRKST